MRLYFGTRVGRRSVMGVRGGVFTMLFAATLWLLWAVYVWLPLMLVRLVVLAVVAVRSKRERVTA